jgi:hypothetical protein
MAMRQVPSAADIRTRVQGTIFPAMSELNDLAFAVVDEEGRRTWLEVAPDGGLTDRAAAKIGEHIVGATEMDTDITGLAFAVVDEEGRRTDLEVGPDGQFTDRVVDRLRERLTGTGAISDFVIASGDSMTGGVSGTAYPTALSTVTGWTVVNLGAGGEHSTTIAGRLGGRPMLVAVDSDTIPASGGVVVTLASDDGEADSTPLLQQDAGTNPVIIAGVTGTLSVVEGPPHVYTFTRAEAGDAVPVPFPVPLITLAMRTYRSGIHVMWWGTNDNPSNADRIIARQRALIEHITDLKPRYLVIGLLTATNRLAINAQLLQAYGRRFVDLLAYLSTYAALDAAGITPTSDDDTAIAAGDVPPSLQADATHLNDAGNALAAQQVAARIDEMGWLTWDAS